MIVASTAAANIHRLRRGPLNPFFSKVSIRRLEPLIQEKVEQLCVGLRNHMQRKATVNVGAAFYALSLDTISAYSFGTSWHCLESPDFAPEWEKTITAVLKTTPLGKQLPWLNTLMQKLPASVRRRLMPDVGIFIATKQTIAKRITAINKSLKKSRASQEHEIKIAEESVSSKESVFHAILTSSLPPQEKSLPRVIDEAFVLLISGTDTTAHVLTNAVYHLLANPASLHALKAELSIAIPEPTRPASWKDLEQLPYLRAVINEALRISAVASLRISSFAPHTPTRYKDWTIPPRYPISMNLRSILYDAVIFPEPEKFDPERWMVSSVEQKKLERYLVPFSRGPRACLGLNLAYAEMYIGLANVIRRFEMQLNDVVRQRDVDVVRDCIVGLPSEESQGVRVVILRENVY